MDNGSRLRPHQSFNDWLSYTVVQSFCHTSTLSSLNLMVAFSRCPTPRSSRKRVASVMRWHSLVANRLSLACNALPSHVTTVDLIQILGSKVIHPRAPCSNCCGLCCHGGGCLVHPCATESWTGGVCDAPLMSKGRWRNEAFRVVANE